MSIKGLFKNWSDDKKKVFSIILAGIITVLIVIVWFSLYPMFGTNSLDENKTPAIDTSSFSDSLNKITEQYNNVLEKISNLTGTTTENSHNNVEISTSTI